MVHVCGHRWKWQNHCEGASASTPKWRPKEFRYTHDRNAHEIICMCQSFSDICGKLFVKRFLNASLNRTRIAVVQSHFLNFRVSSKYVESINNATIPCILIGVTISMSRNGERYSRTLTGTARDLSTCTNFRMASDSLGIISPNT